MTENMKKPNKVYPSSPTSAPAMMPLNIPDVSLRGEAFDQLLENRGIRFVHRRAAPCPNMKTVFDNSHNPNCPICDGEGVFFYAESEIWGVFYSNSLEKNFEMQGIWEIGSAIVTLPTEYPDGKQAEFNTWDQLVIPDFTVRMWEMKAYEPRPKGQQQLRYPIANTDYVAGAINDALVVYQENVDFHIVDGNIQWVAGKEPPYDNHTGRGLVITFEYFANPVYNVLNHMRELRISQEMINGKKIAKRLPQQLLIRREFLQNPAEKEPYAPVTQASTTS
jgi:hypothetical protein